jgi:GTP pyrophosphokinase
MGNIEKVNIENELELIIKKIKNYLEDFNEEKFLKAFDFANKAHEGQFRKDGVTPYIIHPLKTVEILTELHIDEDSLVTALIHDVPEDTKRSLRDVEKLFGKKIAFLVNSITKLSKVYYRHDMAERQIESLKKLLIHSAKDARVILIKLADRLHNMRTLEFVKAEKRLRIAKETLEIYVPIANLLGIDQLKKALEDLCFKHLFPRDYKSIEQKLAETKIRQANLLEETIKITKNSLQREKIKNFEISGREKSRYSCYKKSLRKEKSPDELEDLLALRIMVDNIKDCYHVLGIIHSLFKPKPGRFKDYISVPKSNGYQSLHTIIFGVKGQITEFQIRTHEMHLEAQYGIAAHYFYRTTHHGDEILQKEKQSKWAQKILSYQKANFDSENFIEALKIDIFQDRIFTFTPKGDTIDLPRGATAIDFAYTIHTEVGNNALKVEINGEIVPLTTPLKTGDVIRVITSTHPKGPNREWLIFAKTNLAKNKIRDALKTISRKKKLTIGRRLLQKEFDRAGIGLTEEMSKRKMKEMIIQCGKPHQCKTFHDLLVAVGEGTINPVEIIRVIYPQNLLMRSDPFKAVKKLFHMPQKTNKNRVGLKIKVLDRIGATRDVLNILTENNLNIVKMDITPRRLQNTFTMHIVIEVDSFDQFSYVCEQMEQIDEIIEVQRELHRKRIPFYILAGITIAVWGVHPLVTYYLSKDASTNTSQNIAIYGGIAMLFFLVYQLKRLSKRTFPELRNTGRFLWLLTFLIGNFALFTIIAEIYFYKLNFNWIVVFGLILFIYAYLASEYIDYKQTAKS